MNTSRNRQTRLQQEKIEKEEERWYLDQLEHYPSLPLKGELRLIEQLRSSEGNAHEIQHRLVEAGLHLSLRIARRYFRPGESRLEIIQEANLLLLQAAVSFNPSQSIPFRVYATRKIRTGMEKLARGKRGLDESADGLSLDDVPGANDRVQFTLSGDLIEVAPRSLAEVLAEDPITEQNRGRTLRLIARLNTALNELPERDRRIMQMRYGLGEYTTPHTLEEVGKDLKRTRESIRSCEERSMEKLRASMVSFVRQDRRDTKEFPERTATPFHDQRQKQRAQNPPPPKAETHRRAPRSPSRTEARRRAKREPLREFLVPLARNPYFTGRQPLLLDMRRTFLPSSGDAGSPAVIVLSGVIGTGKTEIAVEYSHRYRDAYDRVVWVDASSPSRLTRELSVLESRGASSRIRETDPFFPSWKGPRSHCLLVLDGVEKEAWDEITSFLRHQFLFGQVLITTRACCRRFVAGHLAVEYPVPFLTSREAVQLLLRYVQHFPTSDEWMAASMLADMLDGYPLALVRIGAQLSQSVSDNGLAWALHLYRQNPLDCLGRRDSSSSRHPKSVIDGIAEELLLLEHSRRDAAGLLRICASLADAPIPEALLKWGIQNTMPVHFALHPAIQTLAERSLVSHLGTSRAVRLPSPLRQAVLATMAPQDMDVYALWAAQATVLTAQSPEIGYDLLVPHIRQALLSLQQRQIPPSDRAYLLSLLRRASRQFSEVSEGTPTGDLPGGRFHEVPQQNRHPPTGRKRRWGMLISLVLVAIGVGLLLRLFISALLSPLPNNPFLSMGGGFVIGGVTGIVTVSVLTLFAVLEQRREEKTHVSTRHRRPSGDLSSPEA